MARQTVKVTTTKRVRKTGGDSGYEKCHICHGSGRVPKQNRKKK